MHGNIYWHTFKPDELIELMLKSKCTCSLFACFFELKAHFRITIFGPTIKYIEHRKPIDFAMELLTTLEASASLFGWFGEKEREWRKSCPKIELVQLNIRISWNAMSASWMKCLLIQLTYSDDYLCITFGLTIVNIQLKLLCNFNVCDVIHIVKSTVLLTPSLLLLTLSLIPHLYPYPSIYRSCLILFISSNWRMIFFCFNYEMNLNVGFSRWTS